MSGWAGAVPPKGAAGDIRGVPGVTRAGLEGIIWLAGGVRERRYSFMRRARSWASLMLSVSCSSSSRLSSV